MANFFFLIVLLWCLKLGSAATKAISVDSSNVLTVLSEPVVLLAFHAPWCGHCKEFSPVFDNLAANLPQTLGRIDITSNQALASRFKIHSIPSLFLIIASPRFHFFSYASVYQYQGSFDYDSVYKWTSSGYKNSEPLSLLESPMGPMGLAKGYLIATGSLVTDFPNVLMSKYNVSLPVAMLICGLTLLFAILLPLGFSVWYSLRF
jgi:thiol-disulfide isomerase/thioredoxin